MYRDVTQIAEIPVNAKHNDFPSEMPPLKQCQPYPLASLSLTSLHDLHQNRKDSQAQPRFKGTTSKKILCEQRQVNSSLLMKPAHEASTRGDFEPNVVLERYFSVLAVPCIRLVSVIAELGRLP
jgi:hypothetical protein